MSTFAKLIGVSIVVAATQAAAQTGDGIAVPGALADFDSVRVAAPLVDTLKGVEVSRVTGTVDLAAAAPVLRVTHELRNPGSKKVSLRVKVTDRDEQALELGAQQRRSVSWTVPLAVHQDGKRIRSVTISPALTADSEPSTRPARNISVDVVLPPGATKLVKSSQPLARVPDQGSVYRWTGRDLYLTPLRLWWTTSPVDVALKKTAQPDWASKTVDVTIQVTNAGQAPAQNVVLRDDFPAELFDADAASQGTFKVYKGAPNDQRLLWEYALPSVPPGGAQTVKYRLKMKTEAAVLSLHETNAIEGGEPVAVSEKVLLAR